MADIDQILAGGAGASSRADFSGIPKILDSYYKGRDEFAKNDLRDAFKDGLPMNGDQPDWTTIAKTFFQKGAIEQGIAAANQGLAQQNLTASRGISGVVNGEPQAPANTGPPSASRTNGVADPAFRQRASTPTPAPQATPLPPDQQQDQASEVVRMPTPQATQAWRDSVPPPVMAQGGPPQPQPQQAPSAPDFNARFNAARPGQISDPTLGGLVPPGRDAQTQIRLLSRAIDSGVLPPAQAKAYQARIEAISKAIEPTGPMKEYDKAVSQGFKGTLEDWQNRADDNTTQRDILTKSLIPRLEKSQETATASVQDIDAIHRSRAELDGSGGVFSGKWADMRLQAAKIGNLLGVADADKITNTEAFSSAIGKRVAAMVKAFGSGTAISDGDRRFAEKMAGGNVELNETSMRRILDIGEAADRAIIDRHNGFADRVVKANDGLKSARDTFIVDHPAKYKKPEASTAVYDAARAAIDKGAPRDAVIKRLRENGHDPSRL